MKKNRFFQSPFQLMGFMALFASIYLMIGSVQNYKELQEQETWPVYTAEVSDISSRVESNRTGKYRGSRTVYDIIYQYEVDGVIYSGEQKGSSNIRMVGDSMKIKYNPEHPASSTTTLSYNLGDLLFPFGVGIVFGVIGFFTSGIYPWIRRMRRKGQPEEKEELPPEEYVDVQTQPNLPNNKLVFFVQRVIPILMLIGIVSVSRSFLFKSKAITVEQFTNTLETEGYIIEDTTDLLREEWRIGSLLEQSASLQETNIRMDFCQMDTVESARNLYNGMSLPVFDGDISQDNDYSCDFLSVEDEKMYTAKIRIGDTVVYIGALAEEKTEVVKLLEKIGYWRD